MTAATYTTKDGDTVDYICFRYYGATSQGQVEAVLEANRAIALADYGPTLPAGLLITLPAINPPPKEIIRLFS